MTTGMGTSDKTTTADSAAPDRAREAASDAAAETLLNCYLREGGVWRPVPAADVPGLAEEGDTYLAVMPFPSERTMLLAGIRHLSPTHRHRFRLPVMVAMAGGTPWPVSLDTLSGMLADELGDTGLGDELSAPGSRGPDPTFLLSRVRQSVATASSFLRAREDEIDALWSAEPLSFIASEQASLLGDMAHPTTKSRWEMTSEQVEAYAPETAARFALRWLAVDPSLVEHDSATGTEAPRLTEQLLRDDPAVDGAALDAALQGLGARVLLPVRGSSSTCAPSRTSRRSSTRAASSISASSAAPSPRRRRCARSTTATGPGS
jgi:siderophore synthetase component